jgi:putative drug exporter of the RND superfamily
MLLLGRRLLWPMRVEQVPARMIDGRAWRNLARFVTTRPAEVVASMLLVLVPMALVGWKVQPTYDSLEEFPTDCSLVRGAELYARHFFDTGRVSEMTLLVSTTQPWGDEERLGKLNLTLDRSAQALKRRFPVLFQRDLADPLGNRRASATKPAAGMLERLALAAGTDAARKFYVGRNGASCRIDLGLGVDPRSAHGMDMVEQIRATVHRTFTDAGIALSGTAVTIVGESATYCDIRALQRSDFQRVAVAAFMAVFTILVLLVRSIAQALILIGATLLAYLSAYGATWAIFHYLLGTTSISYQIDFLLFIVMLSLGQDYNIYLVTRLREELAARSPRRAVELAIRRTGRVVSGCGVIMAAAFGSMYAGSLLVMQQFAVALALGILVDTFVIRPLLVPALLLMFGGLRVRVPVLAGSPSAADAHPVVGGS